MNTDKLLDIINCTLTDENIYELFKNHGYDESFGNLQKDLANLLDKFIVTDGELNEVAGGRASVLTRVSSGILASIASFSGMNFVGAQTLTEEQSKSQKILNNIKETGVNSAKKAAKFVINNGGKIAGGGTLLVTWSLLCALIGRHTKEVPVVETKDMTKDEKNLIGFAQEVLTKIYKDINSGFKKYFNSDEENYDSLQELINGSENIGGIQKNSGDVKVGHLVKELLPEREGNRTQAYIDEREKLIKYESELIDLAKNLIKQYSDGTVETLKQKMKELEGDSAEQKKKLEEVGQEEEQLKEQIKTAEETHQKKITEIEQEKQTLTNQLEQVSEAKKKVENELEDLKKENKQKEEDSKKKDLALNAKDKEIKKLKTQTENLNEKLKLEKEKKEEIAEANERNLLDQIAQLNQKLAEENKNVSLDKWNGIGEFALATLTGEEKTKKLNEWIAKSGTLMADEILQCTRKFLLDDKCLFNVPKKIPASYKKSILGLPAVGWGYGLYHKPADSLDRDQLRMNFVNKKLWLGLFADLEKSGEEKNVDLVFVIFQVCRLAGWSFVPETICKALLEHYKNCRQNKTTCNEKLKDRINQLLKSCGLELKDNGIYLNNGVDHQPPVF